MFDSARDCTWLKCIDTIMHIMIKKIAKLDTEYRDKQGVVSRVAQKLKQLYDACAGWDVLSYDKDDTGDYVIIRPTFVSRIVYAYTDVVHKINVKHSMCTCGKWQNYHVLMQWLISETIRNSISHLSWKTL